MEQRERKRFERALERKHEEAERRGRQNQPGPGGAPPEEEGVAPEGQADDLFGSDRTQDTSSVRDKNTGHGGKTADKWNQ